MATKLQRRAAALYISSIAISGLLILAGLALLRAQRTELQLQAALQSVSDPQICANAIMEGAMALLTDSLDSGLMSNESTPLDLNLLIDNVDLSELTEMDCQFTWVITPENDPQDGYNLSDPESLYDSRLITVAAQVDGRTVGYDAKVRPDVEPVARYAVYARDFLSVTSQTLLSDPSLVDHGLLANGTMRSGEESASLSGMVNTMFADNLDERVLWLSDRYRYRIHLRHHDRLRTTALSEDMSWRDLRESIFGSADNETALTPFGHFHEWLEPPSPWRFVQNLIYSEHTCELWSIKDLPGSGYEPVPAEGSAHFGEQQSYYGFYEHSSAVDQNVTVLSRVQLTSPTSRIYVLDARGGAVLLRSFGLKGTLVVTNLGRTYNAGWKDHGLRAPLTIDKDVLIQPDTNLGLPALVVLNDDRPAYDPQNVTQLIPDVLIDVSVPTLTVNAKSQQFLVAPALDEYANEYNAEYQPNYDLPLAFWPGEELPAPGSFSAIQGVIWTNNAWVQMKRNVPLPPYQGCAAEFWRGMTAGSYWMDHPGYSPDDNFYVVFAGFPVLEDVTTLEDALAPAVEGEDPYRSLAREATVALLNAAAGEVGYGYDANEIISMVTAVADASILAEDLHESNLRGCPLISNGRMKFAGSLIARRVDLENVSVSYTWADGATTHYPVQWSKEVPGLYGGRITMIPGSWRRLSGRELTNITDDLNNPPSWYKFEWNASQYEVVEVPSP